MTHTEKLFKKANELKNSGIEYAYVGDGLYDYHASEFFYGNGHLRKEFNIENGLSEHARPEKSIWRVWEIVDCVFGAE